MNSTRAKHRVRRKIIYAVLVCVAVVFVWSVITTPTVLGPVPVEFAWDQSSGFKYIRTVGKFASATDPPYNHMLTNPFIIMQVKPRISKMLRSAGLQSAKGRLEFRVVASSIVLGLDATSETSFVEHSQTNRLPNTKD